SICHFFVFGEQFKMVMPEVYEVYRKVFNMETGGDGVEPVVSGAFLEKE
ncbi:MAG: hypothetical protein ACI9VN_001189, partial [Patescibacteria group bacterium]